MDRSRTTSPANLCCGRKQSDPWNRRPDSSCAWELGSSVGHEPPLILISSEVFADLRPWSKMLSHPRTCGVEALGGVSGSDSTSAAVRNVRRVGFVSLTEIVSCVFSERGSEEFEGVANVKKRISRHWVQSGPLGHVHRYRARAGIEDPPPLAQLHRESFSHL